MRFASYTSAGAPSFGLVFDGGVMDLLAAAHPLRSELRGDSLPAFIAGGEAALNAARQVAATLLHRLAGCLRIPETTASLSAGLTTPIQARA